MQFYLSNPQRCESLVPAFIFEKQHLILAGRSYT